MNAARGMIEHLFEEPFWEVSLLLAGVVTIQQRSVALFEQTLANDRVDAATSRTAARLTAELSSAPARTGLHRKS